MSTIMSIAEVLVGPNHRIAVGDGDEVWIEEKTANLNSPGRSLARQAHGQAEQKPAAQQAQLRRGLKMWSRQLGRLSRQLGRLICRSRYPAVQKTGWARPLNQQAGYLPHSFKHSLGANHKTARQLGYIKS